MLSQNREFEGHILEREYLTTNDVSLVPAQGQVSSRSDVSVHSFLYSAPMDTVTGYQMCAAMLEAGQFPVVSRFIPKSERNMIMKEFGADPNLFWAVGMNRKEIGTLFDELSRTTDAETNEELIEQWADFQGINLAIDIAHGDMRACHELVEELATYPIVGSIMSGSICTPYAALRAVKAGCTHLRVGVGPGAACTTRLMTGVGVPNLTAVYQIASAVRNIAEDVEIIADGGIKNPGDVVKYLAAGATAVMLGSALSKTREAAGWEFVEENPLNDPSGIADFNTVNAFSLVKSYRGQASAEFQEDILGKANRCPEGAASPPFQWEGLFFEDVFGKFCGGLQSACSYLGARSTTELHPGTVRMIKISSSGYLEGTPHGV